MRSRAWPKQLASNSKRKPYQPVFSLSHCQRRVKSSSGEVMREPDPAPLAVTAGAVEAAFIRFLSVSEPAVTGGPGVRLYPSRWFSGLVRPERRRGADVTDVCTWPPVPGRGGSGRGGFSHGKEPGAGFLAPGYFDVSGLGSGGQDDMGLRALVGVFQEQLKRQLVDLEVQFQGALLCPNGGDNVHVFQVQEDLSLRLHPFLDALCALVMFAREG